MQYASYSVLQRLAKMQIIYFLALATLRGTILSADIELTILSMSTFAGITGAPYGRFRVDPDLFLPFHGGLDGLS